MDQKFEMVISTPKEIHSTHAFVQEAFGPLKDRKLGDFQGCSLFGASRENNEKNKVRIFFQLDSPEELFTSSWLKDFFIEYFSRAPLIEDEMRRQGLIDPGPERPEVVVHEVVPFGIERTRYGVRNAAKTVNNILSSTSASLVRDPITIKDQKPVTITTKRR